MAVGVRGDLRVLRGRPLGAVENEHHDRSAANRGEGFSEAPQLEPLLGAGPPPYSRGIDEHELTAFEIYVDVDRVARRARALVYDDPLAPRESVKERRLPDVRPPDYRDA